MEIKQVKEGLQRCIKTDSSILQVNSKCFRCPYSPQCEEGEYTILKADALKAIENLEKAIEEKQKHLENLQKVNEDLEERIAIMSEGMWHDAEKDPPKEDGTYIILDQYGQLQALDYDTCSDNGEKWGYWQECFDQFGKTGDAFVPYEVKVIYWMFQPGQPKEGE